MTEYRLYLLASLGVVGRDDFDASDDEAAGIIAELIWEACSDECDSYELWQRMRFVRTGCKPLPHPPVGAAEITAKMQESLIGREEAIQRSRWLVARSKRLLERLNGLRVRAR